MKCVYCLDFANGKRYVGSTSDLKKRLIYHRNPYCNKNNVELKEAIIQGDYEVVILEQLPDDATKTDLLAREQHYSNLWWGSGILYNKRKNVKGGSDSHTKRKKKTIAWEHVEEIKALRAAGLAYKKIGIKYNCSIPIIKKICLS